MDNIDPGLVALALSVGYLSRRLGVPAVSVVPVTPAGWESPSISSLPHVSRMSIGHEVRRTDAPNGAAIAQMGDFWLLGWWLLSRRQDVGNDVCRPITALKTNDAVAITPSPRPYPAWAKFRSKDWPILIDARPETGLAESMHETASTQGGTGPAGVDPIRVDQERGSAYLANSGDARLAAAGYRTEVSRRRGWPVKLGAARFAREHRTGPGTLRMHQAHSWCQAPGVDARRGHIAARFYHVGRGQPDG